MPADWRSVYSNEQKARILAQIEENVEKKYAFLDVSRSFHIGVFRNRRSLSNGSLMRVAPLAIRYFRKDKDIIRKFARDDASLTHVDDRVKNATEIYVMALCGLLRGKDKEVNEKAISIEQFVLGCRFVCL